jgi:uncharacterized membrane protein YozB (DUF420 family)
MLEIIKRINMTSAIFFQIQSLIIFSLLTLGVVKRKNKNIHTKTMLIAIVWDLLLVLQIELNRGAILKASKATTNPFILNFHVSMAVTCVLLYIFMLYSGKFLKIGEYKLRSLHKRFGFATYIIRFITLITSYWVVFPKE